MARREEFNILETPQETAARFRRKAQNGDVSSQFNLGAIYHLGIGVDEDFNLALLWYGRAAAHRFAPAQNNLAIMHKRGLGVKTDNAEASRLLKLSAAQGYALAQTNILGLTHDKAEQIRWDDSVAELEDTLAQYKLGVAYAAGDEITQNIPEALRWLKLAASQNIQVSSGAQLLLGDIFFLGTQVNKDYKEAVHWYELAAYHGTAEAQFKLGKCYENGLGMV
jgi:TPR repeat protein